MTSTPATPPPLVLALATPELPSAREAELRFAIVDDDGRPARRFAVEHEKRMHLILVRHDGEGFQHLHPDMAPDGTWRVRTTIPEAGSYRVFADFKTEGKPLTLVADLAVEGAAELRPWPAPAKVADAGDGYEVRLDAARLRAGRAAELRFTISRGGQVVQSERYLGAGGHLVALREGDLAYLHVHPAGYHDAEVPFMTELPSAGRYRLYLQFQHTGRVQTAEFTIEVA